MSGILPILAKEARQMMRDGGTLRFALAIPAFQLILFGLIDSNVRHVPTMVFDQSRTQASRALVDDFVNTSLFDVVGYVDSRAALHEEIVAGHVQVGIEIPPDYARRQLARESADVLVLIDGSDSSIASQTLSAATGLALSRSLDQLMREAGRTPRDGPPLMPHPVMLFNPDSRSANLLIPGLVAILLTFSGTLLAAFSIVRERERGTLEQLMVTPLTRAELIIGKLVPFIVIGYLQLTLTVVLMRFLFKIPIAGSVVELYLVGFLFIAAVLGLGVLISTVAQTMLQAMQLSMFFLLPFVFLSGYVFPIDGMPVVFQYISRVIPARYFIEVVRGIVLRGASLRELWQPVAWLTFYTVVIIGAAVLRFKKTTA